MNTMQMPIQKCAYDDLSQDELLMQWNIIKGKIEAIKTEEMDLRKYIVSRAFPEKHEGTQNKDLGNNYKLKAVIKYTYSLSDNNTVEAALDRISKIGNTGSFIADRLVSWHPTFLVKEYRNLEEQAKEGDNTAKQILKEVHSILTIKEASPTLEIVEPKSKK